MTILTERLELRALTAPQLRRLTEDLPALERELDCRYRAEPLEGVFLDIVKGQLIITEGAPQDYMWHSFWLIIRQSDRVAVGSADFKGLPDAEGRVEIGYGLGREYEHGGYMTEAAAAMCAWALGQPGVARIIAETDADGYASQRVLKRCGFREYPRDGGCWWSLQARDL